MWRRVGIGTAFVAVVAIAVLLYPVGGVVWSAGQVDRLALVDGERRSETGSQVAIKEALTGVRADRFRRMLSAVTGGKCHPRYLEFLTDSGWISTPVQCPSGFFLDFVPPPAKVQPSKP